MQARASTVATKTPSVADFLLETRRRFNAGHPAEIALGRAFLALHGPCGEAAPEVEEIAGKLNALGVDLGRQAEMAGFLLSTKKEVRNG